MASNDPPMNVRLMRIDRSLNYGRHHIENYLRTLSVVSIDVALDIGAGHGDDLLLVRKHHASAKLHAFEVHPPYQNQLAQHNIEVYSINIEHDVFPFTNKSVDVIIPNQIFEHVKKNRLFTKHHEF
jgi:hypothetical protein